MVSTRSSTRKLATATPTPDPPSTAKAPLEAIGNGNGKKRASESSNDASEVELKRQRVFEPVDKTRWRLNADGGRHTWHYLEDDDAARKWPQSYADKWYLDLPLVGIAISLRHKYAN